jgi:hypothetical protein
MSLTDDFQNILNKFNIRQFLKTSENAEQIRKDIWEFKDKINNKTCLLNLIIPKQQLTKDNYYSGQCRNAYIARWNGEHFTHWRDKFGFTFLEDIDYWEDGHYFDEFIPIFDLGPELPKEISFDH